MEPYELVIWVQRNLSGIVAFVLGFIGAGVFGPWLTSTMNGWFQ